MKSLGYPRWVALAGCITEYKAYMAAKNRCTNVNSPKYKDYGGRGIQFLLPTFEDFLSYIGPRPVGCSLDRIDNNGPYSLANIRWATATVQANNQRVRTDAQSGQRGVYIIVGGFTVVVRGKYLGFRKTLKRCNQTKGII